MEIAALGLKIEGVDGIDRARDSLGRFVKAAQDAEKSTEGVKDSSGRARDEFGRFKKSTDDAAKGASGLGKESDKASKSIFGLGRSSDSAASSMNSLGSTATKVGGVLAAAFSITKVIQYADAWSDMQSRVGAATGQMDLAAGNMQRLLQIANASYSPLQQTSAVYARNVATFRDLGRSAAEAADFTEAVNNAMVTTATRGQDAEVVINSLSRALATGKLDADAFDTIVSRSPRTLKAVADEMGVTTSALRKLATEGKVTSDVIARGLTGSLEALRAEAAEMPATMGDAFVRVGNNMTAFVGIMDQATGASGSLANAIISVSDAALEIATSGDVIAGFVAWKGTIEAIAQDFVELDRIISDFTSNATDSADSISFSFGEMPANIRAMIQIAVVEIASFIDAQMNGIRALGAAIEALPSGPSAAMEAFNSVRAQMQQLGEIREESIADILNERDAIIQAGRDAANSYAETGRKALEFNGAVVQTVKSTAQAAAGISKIDSAFQSLMDSLYPAEAAQRKHNEQIALLRKYLSGNQLADAISRLNKSIAGADATGPADAIEAYREELEKLQDRIDPVRKATREYEKDVARLKEGLDRGEISIERHAELLAKLDSQYAQTSGAASEWGQFTERALDSVDQAFADAWKNIDQGFSGFADGLKNAFKNLLAELAHMAITRPIIMQFASMLGIGGAQGQGGGLLGGLFGGGGSGGGSSGGIGFGNLLSVAQGAYSALTGWGPAAMAGWQAGGLGGAIGGVGSYYGGMLSGAASTVGGWLGLGGASAASGAAAGTGFGLGGTLVSGGIGNASYAAGSSGLGSIFSGMASAWPLAVALGIWQSGKLYDQGVRPDMSDMWASTQGNTLGKIGNVAPTLMSGFYKGLDSILEPVVGGKLAAMITGSTFHQALWGGINKKLFGGDWETKNYGLTAEVANGGFGSFSYRYEKKDGGWFGSDKKRTTYTPIDQETNQALNDTYDAVESGVVSLFERLNLSVSEAALAGINIARKNISTKGKTEEEIQQAISDWFTAAGESINTQLNAALGTGLDYDLAGMQAFVGNLEGVNEVLRYLDVTMYDMSVAGGKLAEALSAAAGGLDALATNSATYYDAFFSEAEKVEDTIDSIKRAFEAADVELVGSREAYRAMVEDIDLTTEAGQQMFATLMALSGQAATYYDILEARAAQSAELARQAAEAAAQALAMAIRGGVDIAFSALQRSIAKQQSDINAAVRRTNNNITALTGISNTLSEALKKLTSSSTESVRAIRAQAVMQLNSAVVQVRSGRSVTSIEGLSDAVNTAANIDTAIYGSLADFEREQGRTANLIQELGKAAGKELSIEQLSLRVYESQLSALKEQLDFAQSQLDALNGIDNSIIGVADAVNAMNASVVAALSTMADGLAQLNTQQNNRTIVDTLYKSILGREADSAGRDYWVDQLQSGKLDYDQIAVAIGNAATQNQNETVAGQASAQSYLASTVNSAYQSILGRSADQAGLDYWVGQLRSGAIAGDELYRSLALGALANANESADVKARANQWLGIPQFAAGGAFTNGIVSKPTAFNMGIMGEAGSEGILPLANIGGRLGVHANIGGNDELKAVKAELSEMKRVLVEIMWSSKQTADATRSIDEGGVMIDSAAVA